MDYQHTEEAATSLRKHEYHEDTSCSAPTDRRFYVTTPQGHFLVYIERYRPDTLGWPNEDHFTYDPDPSLPSDGALLEMFDTLTGRAGPSGDLQSGVSCPAPKS